MAKKTKKPRKCKSKRADGKPCRNYAVHGHLVCTGHLPKEEKEKRGFGGAQEGSGRPRKPHADDELRRRVEANIDKWLQPFEEALTAEVGVVVGTGKDAHLETFPDHRTRLRAAMAVLDRVNGRPVQMTELTGPDGGPIKVSEADFANPKVRKELHGVVRLVGGARASRTGRNRARD